MKKIIKLVLSLSVPIILISIILYRKGDLADNTYPDNRMILTETNSFRSMFGYNLAETDKRYIEEVGRKMLSVLILKPQFFRALAVVEKWEKEIVRQAESKSIPSNIALGMALLENGGSEKAFSYAGAAGIFQITKNTAEILGLKVEGSTDERLDPAKNIEAGLRYLSNNLTLFPDIGIAVWSYHAGEQNISKALKVYLEDLGEQDAFDLLEAEKLGKISRAKEVWRAYLTKDDLNIHKLLQNQRVKNEVIVNLGDETELYPYKILATSVLYEAYKNYAEKVDFITNIELYRQGRILLTDLLSFSPVK